MKVYILLGMELVIFAYMLLKWLQHFRDARKIRNSFPEIHPTIGHFPVGQQDQRYLDMIKRIDNVFKEQQDQLKTRALKPHDSACMDPLFCSKSPCFVYAPDIIVKTTTVKAITKRQRMTKSRKNTGSES